MCTRLTSPKGLLLHFFDSVHMQKSPKKKVRKEEPAICVNVALQFFCVLRSKGSIFKQKTTLTSRLVLYD